MKDDKIARVGWQITSYSKNLQDEKIKVDDNGKQILSQLSLGLS